MPSAIQPTSLDERKLIISAMADLCRFGHELADIEFAFKGSIAEAHPDRAGEASSERARIYILARQLLRAQRE